MSKVYVELDNLSREELIQLLLDKEEDNVRLVQNLAEYKNEITDLKEENKKLIDKADKLEKVAVKLMLKTHHDMATIDGEVVIDMSKYKVIKNKKPKEEKLF